jgi:hypothetical protein
MQFSPERSVSRRRFCLCCVGGALYTATGGWLTPREAFAEARGRNSGERCGAQKQGRSRDETVAAKPTAAYDAKWGNFVIDPGFFTRLVYEGV